jgi:hypothetical protein
MFKFGRGPKALELLGPSIAYFWNDIYDVFDIEREMTIERLDSKVFSIVEVKRLFNDLSEDMEEDFAEIWLEIQNEGKRLVFLESNILPGISLDEQQQMLEEYIIPFERPLLEPSSEDCRILNFASQKTIALLVYLEPKGTDQERIVDSEKVKMLIDRSRELCAKRSILLTWHEITDEAKSLAKQSNIELLNSEIMLREINNRNLELALDTIQLAAGKAIGEKFSTERFRIYLDFVKSARSNLAKKESLENLSRFFLNDVKGFRFLEKNYRGPSEEFDLIIANESSLAPLKTIGNPLAVECRHRKYPASSSDIRDFCGKLTSAGLKAGILISLKGITGNRYDAIDEIRNARKKDISIIVITLEDLTEVVDGKKPIEVIRDCFYKYV